MSGLLVSSFLRNPAGFLVRGFRKIVVYPLRYARGADYDASKYWGDRFEKYGLSLRGPGYEGASDEENLKAYREAAERLFGVIRGLGLDLGRVRVLDIGCGNGFYAGLFKDAGVVDYTGVDVTDVLFPRLREAYPGYQFVQKDITSEGMGAERFDLVLMIDVIEHIVTSEKLNNAMENVKGCLKAGGVFMVSPVFKSDRRLLFNVKEWMREDIVSRFEGYALDVVSGFRGADMLLVRRG